MHSRQRLNLVPVSTDATAEPVSSRVLVTMLFVDIVESTAKLACIGDRAWTMLLNQYRAAARDALILCDGQEIVTAGDAFLATFAGPSRAILCAARIHAAANQSGISVRAGLHVGEVEQESHEVTGIAVHIGARIAALAGAGETLVSGIVRELVAGSGLGFLDCGVHVLRGVQGHWPLYAVARAA